MAEPKRNIDAEEIRKFSALSQHWWDPNGKLKALHDINDLRLDVINRCMDLNGKQVIDVGCGGGILSEAMAAAGAVVTGIDISRSALSVARNHAEISGLHIDYRQSTVEEMAEADAGRFDLVVCMELLEHVPDPGAIIRACGMLTRDGGAAVFATLNRNLKSWFFAIVGAEYILGLVPRGTHVYRKFIKPSELHVWAERSGFMRDDIIGLHYNPFLRRYSLGGNVHVNYLALYKKR